MPTKSDARALRAESSKLDRDLDAARAVIQEAIRAGANTAALRQELRQVEARRAEIVRRLAEAEKAAQQTSEERVEAAAELLVCNIRSAIDRALAALEPPDAAEHP
jgi:chromosome segregation ATPase